MTLRQQRGEEWGILEYPYCLLYPQICQNWGKIQPISGDCDENHMVILTVEMLMTSGPLLLLGWRYIHWEIPGHSDWTESILYCKNTVLINP